MRVIHLSTSDILGGAARCTYRIHRALMEAGIDSRLLVSRKSSGDPTVIEAYPGRWGQLRHRWHEVVEAYPLRRYPQRTAAKFSPGWNRSSIAHVVNALQPEVVHVHWINHGFLGIRDLPQLRAPLVWQLLDHWPFTGGCHFQGPCVKFETACGACPVLQSIEPSDLSAKTLQAKRTAWHDRHIELVAPNAATLRSANASAIFKRQPATQIPIAVDTNVFQPVPMAEARLRLGLDSTALVIACGSSDTTDPRKGFDIVRAALARWVGTRREKKLVLACFGGGDLTVDVPGITTRSFGFVSDETTLVQIYSAADAMIVASREETGPAVTAEALACGTPVIGFPVGMTADVVAHERNGYLASVFDPNSLAAGIDWIAGRRGDSTVRNAARESAVLHLDARSQVPRYLEVYRRAIEHVENAAS